MDITVECTQDIDVVCADCGEILSAEQDRTGAVRVDLCDECLDNAVEDTLKTYGIEEDTP